MQEVPVPDVRLDRFEQVLEPEAFRTFRRTMERAAEGLRGRTVWNVNSTASGGGVAEILHPALGYLRGCGIDARWLVIDADERFFELTKRIHNLLHGDAGDRDVLGSDELAVYERGLEPSARELSDAVSAGDVVVIHDPQPAGLIAAARDAGALTVWRCHIGVDEPNEAVETGRGFLRRSVEAADAAVFSRAAYVWPGLARTAVIAPSIDPHSLKNQELDPGAVEAILAAVGLRDGPPSEVPTFTREDGSDGRVERPATIVQEEPIPSAAPIVTQISRWDRLKDPIGVLRGFVRNLPPESGAHLVLAGPAVEGVRDDPEQAEVAREVTLAAGFLPAAQRRRIHLAFLPTEDREENAIVVNALQRGSDVVIQKSLAEGFGLTVAEAMWKRRPVVASAVGGIGDQIEDGRSGRLIEDPADPAAFGVTVMEMLADRDRARAMGEAARTRVRERFLPNRHLREWAELVAQLMSADRQEAS